ncbi:thiamine-phosphate pyrophosphorylase [Helicobacter burdigaliensis]|uniref:thiamine-phosphate pyrophosphorylase n=1 Tax=Helicobacter burdigaliensis TaxID=2315334 RepID=UPI000EF740EE|nr:thiamine-phosphate pyrophosphorylase [Helicobacter burdigaliensis]
MSKEKEQTFRIIDANLNRLREGIRVVEDILRYYFNHKEFSQTLKNLRHQCILENEQEFLPFRDSLKDVLKPSSKEEQNRTSLKDICIANFKRAEESSRVLEEILKLDSIPQSQKFKNIRYELYMLEKEVILKLFI